MNAKKQKLLISPATDIRTAMQRIDEGAMGIALVVDGRSCLLGTATDGDIRRAILRGVSLEAPIESVMTKSPRSIRPTTDVQEIRRVFLESKVKHLPVTSAEGQVLDIVLIDDLLTLPLSNPDITEREIEAVLSVLRTSNLSLGPKVLEFEKKIAGITGRRFAVAVNSGTSGLHLIVRSLGLKEGDEVITTPFSFIASSNCLLYERVRPVFVDIEPDTYNLDPTRIEAALTPRTRAILAVDVFGQPAAYEQIDAIARRRSLPVISDSCESIGAIYRGRPAGSFGVAGVFGFYPNKQITTGEGGVVVTDDADMARLCASMRNQGRGESGAWLAHERLGYNYRLSDINCALGVVQLERLEEILGQRQRVAEHYHELLGPLREVQLPVIRREVERMSWFVYVVRLRESFSREDRDSVLLSLRRRGVAANNYFAPIHLQPFYREMFGFKEGDFPVTEAVAQRTIALPFHNQMSREDCALVARRLGEAIAEVGGR